MTTTPTTAEPLFHLRAYGDVTEAELTKYATPAEIAQPATPEPPLCAWAWLPSEAWGQWEVSLNPERAALARELGLSVVEMRATQPATHVALTDERKAFEAWRNDYFGPLHTNAESISMWTAWQARAALATQAAFSSSNTLGDALAGPGDPVASLPTPPIASTPTSEASRDL